MPDLFLKEPKGHRWKVFWSAYGKRYSARRRFGDATKSGAALAFRLCLSPHSEKFSLSNMIFVFSVCFVVKT